MKQKKALDFATAGFPAGPKAKGVRASFLPTHTQQKGLSPASRRRGCRSGLSPPGSPCHVLPAWLLLNSSKRLLATPWNPGPDFSLPFPTNTCFVGKQALGRGMEGGSLESPRSPWQQSDALDGSDCDCAAGPAGSQGCQILFAGL